MRRKKERVGEGLVSHIPSAASLGTPDTGIKRNVRIVLGFFLLLPGAYPGA